MRQKFQLVIRIKPVSTLVLNRPKKKSGGNRFGELSGNEVVATHSAATGNT
jgi:hypothetical protein